MKLYRVCHKDEAQVILRTHDFSSLGKNYYRSINNNFKYEYGKKYLHFFKRLGDIYYMNLHKDNYVCEYDIPDELLPDESTGFYMDIINFMNLEEIPEYVIESNKISFDYLTKMDRIVEYIDYEDYLYGDLTSMFELVYKKDRELKYEKKLY